MDKEFVRQNTRGFAHIEPQKLGAVFSGENSFILKDGTILGGLKAHDVAILEKLIEKSENGETMSKLEVKKIYLDVSKKYTVSDSYVREIVRQLAGKLEETNYTVFTIFNTSTNRQVAYLFGERNKGGETYSSQPAAYYQTQEYQRSQREMQKLKTQEVERVRQVMPVYLANEIVSSVLNDTLRTLNGNVRVFQERILKRISLNLKVADILMDASTEQVKRKFITDLYSQLEIGFNPNSDTEPKSLSLEERELIGNCNKARALGYDQNRILNATRRHFDIPANPTSSPALSS